MKVQVLGLSHHKTPIDVRERFAFSPEQVSAALDRWRRLQPTVEAVLVSTCNRVELYIAAEGADPPSLEQSADFLARFHGFDPLEIADYLFFYEQEVAARHLFSVASSLDSMVVGEAQILSQVKEAYRIATERETTGPLLHGLFQSALAVAKRVTRETTIHQRRVSIPSVAIADFAGGIFERFDDKQTVVIGAGEMGEETIRYLQDEGAKKVTIVNRSPERADALAAKFKGETAPWDQLSETLQQADIIISTTGAQETVVTLEQFREIDRKRGEGPLFILDLAIPRDFDPAIGELADVYLYSIDDLKTACDENRRQRDLQLPLAETIIEEETDSLLADYSHRVTGPIIRQLLGDWQKLRDEELKRLNNKLPELGDRERQEIERAFDRLLGKLSHPPLESLRTETKSGHGNILLDAFSKLFQLKD